MGEPIQLNSIIVILPPPPASYVEGGGGIFADMAVHDLDMSRFDQQKKVSPKKQDFADMVGS